MPGDWYLPFIGRGWGLRSLATSCIYSEHFLSLEEAIKQEKELKKWRGEKENQLINTTNPTWN